MPKFDKECKILIRFYENVCVHKRNPVGHCQAMHESECKHTEKIKTTLSFKMIQISTNTITGIKWEYHVYISLNFTKWVQIRSILPRKYHRVY